jgi:hypothetical protein
VPTKGARPSRYDQAGRNRIPVDVTASDYSSMGPPGFPCGESQELPGIEHPHLRGDTGLGTRLRLIETRFTPTYVGNDPRSYPRIDAA